MHTEADLLPISALQHYEYCPRQAALIHLERLWADNRFTAEGNALHAKTHSGKRTRRKDTTTTRTLHVRSLKLGITGQCDVVEFVAPDGDSVAAVRAFERLPQLPQDERNRWTITPVEYKRGKPKKNDCDRIQLAAQAMCLEEMLGVTISLGQLYYGEKKRRVDVDIDRQLRTKVETAAREMREIIESRQTPPAEYNERKCGRCSLMEVCMPTLKEKRQSAARWIERMVASDAPMVPNTEGAPS